MLMQMVKQMWLVTFFAALVLFNGSGAALGEVKLVKSQTVFIPSYANIVSGPPLRMTVSLRANLIINNTDPSHPITIVSIDQYDTEGKLAERYAPQPIKLNPQATTRIIMKEPKQESAGVGANFVVTWQAETKVTEPIIDCFMLGSMGNQGFSFTAQSRVIKEETD
jgi:hypothetical protein